MEINSNCQGKKYDINNFNTVYALYVPMLNFRDTES